MRSLLASFALALLVVDASAQQVTLRGQVENVPGGSGFFVDCTDTTLTSSTLDLNAFNGQQVELSGTWNGSSDAPSIDVAAIAAVAKLFEVGGGGKLGDEVRFKVTSDPGDVAIMFAALDDGFLPAHKSGVLLLDFATMLHVATGTVAGDGTFEVKGTIPNDPALDGLVVHGQSLVVFTGGGAVLSNPDCVTLHS
jgi:hypothetical protein